MLFLSRDAQISTLLNHIWPNYLQPRFEEFVANYLEGVPEDKDTTIDFSGIKVIPEDLSQEKMEESCR